MDCKILGSPNVVKRDDAFVVFTDEDEYQKAMLRRGNAAKRKRLESRIEALERQVAMLLKAQGYQGE